MAYVTPDVAAFKTRFVRDFPFADSGDATNLAKVRDDDVSLALTQAGINFNAALWESPAIFAEAFLELAAHYLVVNLQAAAQGVGSQGEWLTQQKGNGRLSASYAIPDRILKSPTLAL